MRGGNWYDIKSEPKHKQSYRFRCAHRGAASLQKVCRSGRTNQAHAPNTQLVGGIEYKQQQQEQKQHQKKTESVPSTSLQLAVCSLRREKKLTMDRRHLYRAHHTQLADTSPSFKPRRTAPSMTSERLPTQATAAMNPANPSPESIHNAMVSYLEEAAGSPARATPSAAVTVGIQRGRGEKITDSNNLEVQNQRNPPPNATSSTTLGHTAGSNDDTPSAHHHLSGGDDRSVLVWLNSLLSPPRGVEDSASR